MAEGSIPRDPSVWDVVGREPEDPMSAAGRDIEKPTEGIIGPDEEPIEEPATEPTVTAPYDTIDVALDGWEYRSWRQWLGKDDAEQKKKADLALDLMRQYDPSASASLEKSEKNPDYSWVFRFGLYGDPGKVTEAIENLDEQLVGILGNWEVEMGTAKALVKRMDGTKEAIEVPKDMMSKDIATTMMRLLEMVQEGGTKMPSDATSKTSELRQIVSPESGEYCSRHKKTGAEHTDEEREEDIWGAEKGEQGGVYLGCDRCKSLGTITKDRKEVICPECRGTGQGAKQFDWPEDERDVKQEAHSHSCKECGTEMEPVNQAHTQYRCSNWKGGCTQADTGVPAEDCEKCWDRETRRKEQPDDDSFDENDPEKSCIVHFKPYNQHTAEEIGQDIGAMNPLENPVGFPRLVRTETQKPWRPDIQPVSKEHLDEEEGRWNEWADEVKEAMSELDKAGEDVKTLRTTKTSTPEAALNLLNSIKELVESTRSWFYEIATQIDQEPVGKEDKDLADELKQVFKDETMKTVFDNLSSMVEKVIAEKQTMAIPN
jgi:uncharacterized protein (UPF0335 family)